MQNEIIAIEQHNGREAVNARELHKALGNKRQFANWIEERISKYGFVENTDFEVFNNFVKNPQGGRPTKDYALSIDMAKELAMVENNEKGRKIRQYFIEREKQARQLQEQIQSQVPKSFTEALLLAAKQQQQLEEQQLQLEQQQEQLNKQQVKLKNQEMDIDVLDLMVEERNETIDEQNEKIKTLSESLQDMKGKAVYLDKIISCKETLPVSSIAQDYGFTARTFNGILKCKGIQYKVGTQWILYKKYLSQGYVQSRTFTYYNAEGFPCARTSTEWTQKGRLFLYNKLKEYSILPLIEQQPQKAQ